MNRDIEDLTISRELKNHFYSDIKLLKSVKFQWNKLNRMVVTNPSGTELENQLSLSDYINLWFEWDKVSDSYYWNNRGGNKNQYTLKIIDPTKPIEQSNLKIDTNSGKPFKQQEPKPKQLYTPKPKDPVFLTLSNKIEEHLFNLDSDEPNILGSMIDIIHELTNTKYEDEILDTVESIGNEIRKILKKNNLSKLNKNLTKQLITLNLIKQEDLPDTTSRTQSSLIIQCV